MRRSVVGGVVVGLLVAVGIGVTPPPAHAIKEFKEEFEARFVNRKSRKRADVALARAVAEAECTICHPGDDKHKLNAFASQVGQLVNKNDKNNKERIRQALERAATISSDPYTPKSPTFGEQMRKGKLPTTPAPEPPQQ
jgi:hypothetical protein